MEHVWDWKWGESDQSNGILTCSAKKEITVKITRVTSTQCVQNLSLSLYTRLKYETHTQLYIVITKKKKKTQV